jgi:hypothetical protein
MFYVEVVKNQRLGKVVFRTDVVGIRKTFLRRKVESPAPNTIFYYSRTPIKEYSAEASIYRIFSANSSLQYVPV